MFEAQKELASKAFYAAIATPVVAARKVRSYGSKLAESAQGQFDELAVEGEKVAKQMRDRTVVEEIQSRVDLEKVQDRVEKLRDQLEGALASWRESFAPAKETAPTEPAAKKPATKPAAKKPAAKKPAAKKPATKPAAGKPTTKATASR